RSMSRQVDVYDPRTSTWSRGPDYPGSSFGIAAVGVGDVVYASGSDGVVHRLKVQGGDWERVTSLAFPRFFHQLVRGAGDTLLAVGGITRMDGEARVRAIEAVELTP